MNFRRRIVEFLFAPQDTGLDVLSIGFSQRNSEFVRAQVIWLLDEPEPGKWQLSGASDAAWTQPVKVSFGPFVLYWFKIWLLGAVQLIP